jgi:ATP-dependent DNA helicase 2 subunit 2
MAEKEATIFIIDVGSTMANANSGRKDSDLDWSMRFVWDKISHIVSLNRKGLCVGVIGLRTDDTNNSMQDDEGYEHISVLQELGPMTLSALRQLRECINISEETVGDAISAIVLAVDMIKTFTKQLKYKRTITLVTDGLGHMDGDDLKTISRQINETKIALNVL